MVTFNRYNKTMRAALDDADRVKVAISKIRSLGIHYQEIATHCKVSHSAVKHWMAYGAIPMNKKVRDKLVIIAENGGILTQ